VLDVGCATGYGTALLARLARKVVGIDGNPRLVAQADARLRELGASNAMVVARDMTEGFPDAAPYAVIVFEGAVARIPDAIADQLAEGGRLVAVVQEPDNVGRAMLMTRTKGVLSRRPTFDAAVPLLPGFQRAPSFVF
jgi:protein-L-isoaspartate(D-aspartate) O-methyltransferase